jgi:hypothetical protein
MKKIFIVIFLLVLLPTVRFEVFSQTEYLTLNFQLSEKSLEHINKFNENHKITVIVDKVPQTDLFEVEALSAENEYRIRTIVKKLSKNLEIYKEEVAAYFPSKIYVVDKITNKENKHLCDGLYSPNLDAIYISVKNFTNLTAIHHEFFHAIQNKIGISDEFKNKFYKLDACNLISDYACTSEKEEMAEAWAISLIRPNKSEKVSLVAEELHPLFLK